MLELPVELVEPDEPELVEELELLEEPALLEPALLEEPELFEEPELELLLPAEEAVSDAVAGVPELVLLVVAAAPESSSPQAVSASVAVLNKAIQTKRPDPIPRLAFCMQPPKIDCQCRSGRLQSVREVARAYSAASVCCVSKSRGSASAPATPLS
jgi:hypothetical protein